MRGEIPPLETKISGGVGIAASTTYTVRRKDEIGKVWYLVYRGREEVKAPTMTYRN